MNINSIIFQYGAVGDYIFLIMIVVASIVQSITQNKKKKILQDLSQGEKEQSRDQVFDVLEKRPEVMKGYDTPKDTIFDTIEKILVPDLEDGKHFWGDDYLELETESKSAKEGIGAFDNSEEETSQIIEEKVSEYRPQNSVKDIPAIRYRSKIKEGFSLRKAVIYSEILNRKYT